MSKYCTQCGAQNEDGYKFCKLCGTKLLESEYINGEFSYSNNEQKETKIVHGSKEEWQTFIGNNSDKIMRKLSNMHYAQSAVSWVWPVAVLSFFFGFFGAAFWALYRKMYKLVAVLIAVAVLFAAAKTAVAFNRRVEIIEQAQTSAEQIFSETEDYQEQIEQLNGFFSTFEYIVNSANISVQMRIVNMLEDIETYSAVILGGMFAMYFYRSHIRKKTENLYARFGNSPEYPKILKNAGGVSGALVVLGVAIMLTVNGILDALPFIFYLI